MASQDSQLLHWHYTEFGDRDFQISGRTLFFVVVLFSILILVTLLFLYARWVFRFRHLPFTADATSAPHLAHARPSQPQGLHTTASNSFPIILHQSSTTPTLGESECCICLGIFQDGDKAKVLPKCHHCYHSECIDKWLSVQSSCPLCRSSLLADSPV